MQQIAETEKPSIDQPVFGDSDDELGVDLNAAGHARVPPARATATTPPVPRLAFASAKTANSTIQRQADCGRDVKVFVMNASLVDRFANAECAEKASGEPFDVEERPQWQPTRDELVGVATTAWEVARILENDTDNAVVIVSRHGKDAPRFLAGCAAGAVRRLVGAAAAQAICGRAAVKPADAKLRRIVDKFKNWSEVVARGAIQSNIV
jgi:hypothetical protein